MPTKSEVNGPLQQTDDKLDSLTAIFVIKLASLASFTSAKPAPNNSKCLTDLYQYVKLGKKYQNFATAQCHWAINHGSEQDRFMPAGCPWISVTSRSSCRALPFDP